MLSEGELLELLSQEQTTFSDSEAPALADLSLHETPKAPPGLVTCRKQAEIRSSTPVEQITAESSVAGRKRNPPMSPCEY